MIDWAYHSKMYFNADKSKQAQKAIFREKRHFLQSILTFGNSLIIKTTCQKHLGLS